MTKSTVWSTEKKKGGAYALDATAVTALTAVTTANHYQRSAGHPLRGCQEPVTL